LVKKLLYLGADLEAVDVDRGTALQHAVYANNEAVVHVLLDAGAMINVDCGEFGNPLQTTVVQRHKSMFKFLMQKGET
jgi:ankyrin repeat protein